MRGHYAWPACLPACLWFLHTWQVSLEKKPQKRKKKKKRGLPSRSLRSVKPLATAKMHHRIGERKACSPASLA
jgi:hypothetical protein